MMSLYNLLDLLCSVRQGTILTDGEIMYTKDDYIAVFDSGVGGISVLRQLRKLMPEENFVYYGDSANAPYGSRPTEEVKQLSLAVADKLLAEYPVKALVVACNTATAAAIIALREAHPDLIVVGIEPAVKLAADTYPGGNVGVLATEVTLREEKFSNLVRRFEEQCTVHRIPAPGLVNLIEAGKNDSPEMIELLKKLLGDYIGKLDALVLGCTHYPFVTRNIASIMGPTTEIMHGGKGTARETKRRLELAGLLRSGTGSVVIRNSANDADMIRLSHLLLESE